MKHPTFTESKEFLEKIKIRAKFEVYYLIFIT
jgi:hypothetical protein